MALLDSLPMPCSAARSRPERRRGGCSVPPTFSRFPATTGLGYTRCWSRFENRKMASTPWSEDESVVLPDDDCYLNCGEVSGLLGIA